MAGTRGRRKPQRYPEELRERTVRMVFEVREQAGKKHGVITRVARETRDRHRLVTELGQAGRDRLGAARGTLTADVQRMAALEKGNRELRRANDILEAASVFFATELDGRPKR